MPRRSEDKITIPELIEIRDALAECKISDSVREKLRKRIDKEITRRENAGRAGGRPKDIEEIIRIDREAAKEIEKEDKPVDENFDFGA